MRFTFLHATSHALATRLCHAIFLSLAIRVRCGRKLLEKLEDAEVGRSSASEECCSVVLCFIGARCVLGGRWYIVYSSANFLPPPTVATSRLSVLCCGQDGQ
uniref:Putative secreted protein n=1 Tax=Anopheles triannulatus TaxID=58253 RepID=A0A2M4B2X6_9DIPT